jgi:hypothetical protein
MDCLFCRLDGTERVGRHYSSKPGWGNLGFVLRITEATDPPEITEGLLRATVGGRSTNRSYWGGQVLSDLIAIGGFSDSSLRRGAVATPVFVRGKEVVYTTVPMVTLPDVLRIADCLVFHALRPILEY